MASNRNDPVKDVRTYISRLQAEIARVNEVVARVAKEAAADIVKRIDKGVPPPNSPAYAKWKKANKKGRKPLVCDGDYRDSIKAREIRPGYWHVGPPPTGNHPSGLPWAKLSNILEHGTSTIPARPHIEPARRSAEDRIQIILKKLNRS